METHDPTLNPDGSQAEKWHCPDCKTHIHLHADPDHPSHDWTRDFVKEHRWVHEQQLVDHGGDRAVLRLALKYPAYHGAILRIHGPVEALPDDHRRQILASAGIEETPTQPTQPQ